MFEGCDLGYLSQEAEGLAQRLEGQLHYLRRVAQHVARDPPRQVRGALGEVSGVLGVDVL
jgi:hypothetical protein